MPSKSFNVQHADLSRSALAEEYNTFVNAMNEYIPSESGKTIRVWGTFPPNASYVKLCLPCWTIFALTPITAMTTTYLHQ